jgi:rod shape-determining protein MreC
MENLLHRYRNITILVAVVFAQLLGLAIQVRKTNGDESSRLIRVWAVNVVTPFEKAIVWMQHGTGNMWREYVYLRGVRQENRDLKMEIERLRLEQVRLSEDAQQARRLQNLLAFKEQFVSKTIPAQVIGGSGSEQSRSVFIDKGSNDGIANDMAVITADGIVGKVLHVYRSTSQILLINDQSSGVGAILENSRLQGVLRGTTVGEVVLERVMSDETVAAGEPVRTSGGDAIFPKGLPVGTVTKVNRTPESFLSIQVKPAVNLSKLEEVLVVTEKQERVPAMADKSSERAVDILARRLPSVPDKPADPKAQAGTTPPNQPADASKPKPNTVTPKPQGIAATEGTTAQGTAPKKTEPAKKPVQSVIEVSDGVTKNPTPPAPKPAAEEPKPPAEQDQPQ